MLALMIALCVTIVVAYMILNKMKAQAVLFAGGTILMAVAVLMGYPLLEAKKSTGFVWFDIFKFIEDTFSTRAAGIGLLIMSVGTGSSDGAPAESGEITLFAAGN